MENGKEIKLPSGSKLKINMAPFAESKRLYQVILGEAKSVRVNGKDETFNLVKDLFCTALSSTAIEEALKPCLERCLYNGQRITDATFEPESARVDYYDILSEVAQENIRPFTNALMQQFSPLLEKLRNNLV